MGAGLAVQLRSRRGIRDGEPRRDRQKRIQLRAQLSDERGADLAPLGIEPSHLERAVKMPHDGQGVVEGLWRERFLERVDASAALALLARGLDQRGPLAGDGIEMSCLLLVAGLAIGLAVACRFLARALFGQDQRVGRLRLLLVLNRQPEALGQQALQHRAHGNL